MKMNKLLMGVVLVGITMTSCKKDLEERFNESQKLNNGSLVTAKKMSEINVPKGFNWEMTRDVNVKISTTDARFGNALHTIQVYSGNPSQGGVKMAEGTVSTSSPFTANLSTATTITEFYLVKIAPDQSKSIEKVKIQNNQVVSTISVSSNITLNKTGGSGPDCTTGCGTVVNNPSGNLNYSSGTICLTGTINISNLTLDNSVTVRVCGTGSINNMNMNGSSAQFIVTSTGNVNFTSTLPIGGNFINYGTVSTDANRNININSNATFTNHGTVNAGKNFNPNGSSVIVNNGTINVAEKLINNSGSDFTNNCKLIVIDDFQNNGLFKNYGYVKCNEETTIQGGSNNEFRQYNGAMLSTKDMQLNGTITGFGTTSLIKVSGQSKGNSGGVVNGAQEYCDMNGIEGPWNSTINGGASQSCNLYISTTTCNPEGNGTAPIPTNPDTDGDGVTDANDAYPSDPSKAYNNAYGTSTVAFEDLFPFTGDYDLNDVVVNYNYNVVTNAANNVVRVEATYVLRATGGRFNNGFGVQFPVNRNLVSGVSGATLEAGQSKAVLIIFSDMRSEMQLWNTKVGESASENTTYTVAFNISNGPSLADFGLGSYNPFIWNGSAGFGRGYEIHLPGKLPTDLANTALFGTGSDGSNLGTGDTYVTRSGRYPWAINIPANFNYPVEKADINTAYLKFANWVSSGGSQNANWYTNESGNRNTEFVY
jgi:LruC domain-containing protein